MLDRGRRQQPNMGPVVVAITVGPRDGEVRVAQHATVERIEEAPGRRLDAPRSHKEPRWHQRARCRVHFGLAL